MEPHRTPIVRLHHSELARKPLVSHKVIVQLIAATSTDKGLTVTFGIDRSRYPRGIKVSKAELAAIKIKRHSFHGEWNYTIKPNKKNQIDAIISHQTPRTGRVIRRVPSRRAQNK